MFHCVSCSSINSCQIAGWAVYFYKPITPESPRFSRVYPAQFKPVVANIRRLFRIGDNINPANFKQVFSRRLCPYAIRYITFFPSFLRLNWKNMVHHNPFPGAARKRLPTWLLNLSPVIFMESMLALGGLSFPKRRFECFQHDCVVLLFSDESKHDIPLLLIV